MAIKGVFESGHVFEISFLHSHAPEKVEERTQWEREHRVKAGTQAVTYARLYLLLDEINGTVMTTFTGKAACAKGDRFERERGRKIALRKLLENTFPKAERTKIWEVYRERR